MEKEVNDIDLRNWVKSCLALQYFKDGLIPFLSEQCEDMYIQNVSTVTVTCQIPVYQCTNCSVDIIKPSHAQVSKCNYRKCNCKRKDTVRCQDNGSCSEVYDLLKNLHVKNEPNFSNTDCSLWSDKNRGPWEQMKCFIFTPGYKDTEQIANADVTALIQICENNSAVYAVLGNVCGQLDQIRKDRNAIYHSGSMKVSNADLQDYISRMKNVLALQLFEKYELTTNMLFKLKELESSSFVITTLDELNIRKTLLKALQDSKKEVHNNAEELKRILITEKVNWKKIEQILIGLANHVDKLVSEINQTTKHLLEQKFEQFDFRKDLSETIGKFIGCQQEQGVLITESHKGIQEILRRLDLLPQEIKRNQSEQDVPGIVRAVIEVLYTTENGNVSDRIVKIINGFQDEADPQLVQHVATVINKIQEGGNTVEEAEKKCVALYIRIPTIGNWIQFCRDWLNGSLTELLKPLQNYLRTFPKCENLELRFCIPEHDFIRSTNRLLDTIVAASGKIDVDESNQFRSTKKDSLETVTTDGVSNQTVVDALSHVKNKGMSTDMEDMKIEPLSREEKRLHFPSRAKDRMSGGNLSVEDTASVKQKKYLRIRLKSGTTMQEKLEWCHRSGSTGSSDATDLESNDIDVNLTDTGIGSSDYIDVELTDSGICYSFLAWVDTDQLEKTNKLSKTLMTDDDIKALSITTTQELKLRKGNISEISL